MTNDQRPQLSKQIAAQTVPQNAVSGTSPVPSSCSTNIMKQKRVPSDVLRPVTEVLLSVNNLSHCLELEEELILFLFALVSAGIMNHFSS